MSWNLGCLIKNNLSYVTKSIDLHGFGGSILIQTIQLCNGFNVLGNLKPLKFLFMNAPIVM